jgi:Gas vesicle protein G
VGLFSAILGLPLAPVRGTIWVAEKVLAEAERQYYDPAAIRSQLEAVAAARSDGTISDDEATALETELVGRLLEAGRRKKG